MSGGFTRMREVTAPNSVDDLFTGQLQLRHLTSSGHIFFLEDWCVSGTVREAICYRKIEQRKLEKKNELLCTFISLNLVLL